jgi:hypothetical protein
VQHKKITVTKVQISYNAIGPHTTPCDVCLPGGTYARLFPRIFTKETAGVFHKGPECVTREHPLYKTALECITEHLETITSIDVFVGKKSSGAVEMISLLCADLRHVLDRVFWIVCHHDEVEKCALLEQNGVRVHGNPQVYRIHDGEHPCREEYVLLGRLFSVR